MPTKGRAEKVRRAIGTVLSQTVEDFELLVLDDTRSSEVHEIIDSTSIDKRVRYIDRKGIGVSEARDLGIRIARGKFMTFLDSDDYWSSRRLERHLNVWATNEIGLSWDRCEGIGGEARLANQPFPGGIIRPPKAAQGLYLGNFIHASSGFTRTNLARGIDFSWTILSDWLFFMKLAEKYSSFFIDETLSYRSMETVGTVSEAFPVDFFYRQAGAVRSAVLRANPRVYAPMYVRRLSRKLRTRLGLNFDGPPQL